MRADPQYSEDHFLQSMLHYRALKQEKVVRTDRIACPVCLIELAVAEKNIVKPVASLR